MTSSLYTRRTVVRHGLHMERPLVEKFCIFIWQARMGREIERYKEKGKRK
jgi:hypothetical protein